MRIMMLLLVPLTCHAHTCTSNKMALSLVTTMSTPSVWKPCVSWVSFDCSRNIRGLPKGEDRGEGPAQVTMTLLTNQSATSSHS